VLLGTAASNVNFTSVFRISGLTALPAGLDMSSGNNFNSAWQSCTALTSFPSGAKLGTSAENVSFISTWRSSGLTSFPADIDLGNGRSFNNAWRQASLKSFPAIESTQNGTSFSDAWYNCTSLVTFGNANLSSGANFSGAWQNNTALTDFSADVFTNWNPASITSGVFNLTWDGCSALTAQSVENILTSISASGKHATSTGASGGAALADAGIDIDYNTVGGTSPLSAATNTAIDSLSGKGWEVFINGVLTIPNILDLAPAAAYSLRSFDSAADPDVVNVRRSSDSATSDFKASEVSDGTLTAWVGSGNDGHVTKWHDQGGTNHAAQTEASRQPKIVDGGVLVTEGGLPSINFPTEVSNLGIAHSDLYGQATLDSYYVTKSTGNEYIYPSLVFNSSVYGMVARSGDGSTDVSNHYGSPVFYANGTQISGAGATRDTLHPATSGVQKLVAHIGANTTDSRWGTASMNFGNYNNNLASSIYSFTGKLQEMIFFNTDQSANRTGIEKNINDTYTIY
jgi:hypothetical protein